MADDVTFTLNADSTPPAGTIAATDEITVAGPHLGAHAGIAKLAISADGDGTHVPATVADGMLVNLGTNNDVTVAALPLPAGASTLAEQQTQTASLSVLDDWDETNRAAVNLIAGQVGVQGGIGDVTALTQRVVEARADTGAQTSVADNAASTTLISANANRVKVLITNDSSARLYIRFEAAAASLTAYGVSLAQHEAWEELNYTGEIRGIWATDPGDGAARITEFT